MGEENKHTPGPWRIDYDGVLCAPKNEQYGRKHDVRLASFPWSSFQEFNGSENKANARLMAAAPDLLEALEQLLSVMDVDGPATDDDPDEDSVGWNGDGTEMPMTFGHLRRARSAIAKARGEA